MHINVLIAPGSAHDHIRQALPPDDDVRFGTNAGAVVVDDSERPAVLLVHMQSLSNDLKSLLTTLSARHNAIAVLSDVPTLEELLSLALFPVNAYGNSYMGAQHYAQMLEMISLGQHWYPPDLVRQALTFARRTQPGPVAGDRRLTALTSQEREMAHDVAEGLSDRAIAGRRGIEETAVRRRLSRIFQKLDVNGRQKLAALLQSAKSGKD